MVKKQQAVALYVQITTKNGALAIKRTELGGHSNRWSANYKHLEPCLVKNRRRAFFDFNYKTGAAAGKLSHEARGIFQGTPSHAKWNLPLTVGLYMFTKV